MGHQIIKQPDGKYCIWSTITDDLIVLDMTKEDMIKWYGDNAKNEAEIHTQELFEKLEKGENPYFQFQKSFSEAAKAHLEKNKDYKPDEFTKHLKKLTRMKSS